MRVESTDEREEGLTVARVMMMMRGWSLRRERVKDVELGGARVRRVGMCG